MVTFKRAGEQGAEGLVIEICHRDGEVTASYIAATKRVFGLWLEQLQRFKNTRITLIDLSFHGIDGNNLTERLYRGFALGLG